MIIRNPGTGKRYGTHWTQITRARMHWSHTLQPGRMCLNPALRPRSYRYWWQLESSSMAWTVATGRREDVLRPRGEQKKEEQEGKVELARE